MDPAARARKADASVPSEAARRTLLEISRVAMKNVTLTKAADEFLVRALRACGAQGGAVYMYDGAREELILVAQRGVPAEALEALRRSSE